MKKICLAVLGSLIFTTLCFAQNYYALVEVQIKNSAGMTFTMNTVTKVPDQETCAKVLYPIEQLKDKYQVRTQCVGGQEWDKLFADVFANKPASALYIAYKDLSGYETRINNKILADANSATPGRPMDPPVQELIRWASAMMEALEKGGIKNAKIIYPRQEKK